MKVIPAQFELLGHTVEVIMRDDLDDECGCDGRWTAGKNLIEIQTGHTDSYTKATFWHEVVHAISEHMGMEELNKDEEKVDKIAQGICQVLKSKKGNADG